MGHIYRRNRILSNLQAFAKTHREEKKREKIRNRGTKLLNKTMVELNRRAWIRKLFTRFWDFLSFFPYLPNLPRMIILQV